MGGVPSVPTDRTRTPLVIAAGYSRTGTVSMATALEKLLDGPVLHCGTHLVGREDAYPKLWTRLLASQHDRPLFLKLLREATAGFVAVADMPACMFMDELMELYPEAKVVLVDRDVDRWWKSLGPIMEQSEMPGWLFKGILLPCPGWRWAPYWLNSMAMRERTRFGPNAGKEILGKLNALVRDAVPNKKNLLEMELKQGWAPLCAFLDEPVPQEPFPRENDAEALDRLVKRMFRTAFLIWGGILLGVGAMLWAIWNVWS